MKTLLISFLAFGVITPTLHAQQPRPLRIMVERPKTDDWTPYDYQQEFLRSKMVSSLSRQCHSACVVTEQAFDDDDTHVDAVLTGSYAVLQRSDGYYYMHGSMRLVAKNGTVMWSDTVHSSLFARSASSSFADEVAKKLTTHLKEQHAHAREASGQQQGEPKAAE